MNKSKAKLWIMLFVILTASPAFTYFFLGQYVDTINYENRNLEDKPVLTLQNYETFAKEFEAYYNDNIPFRNQLIRFNNSIDYFIFNQSSDDNVVIGKDGFLFFCSDTDGNPIEQSLGYWKFTDDELRLIAENLTSSKRVLESQGIEFILYIAPNKETIYRDKLPEYYETKDAFTCTDQLIEYLKDKTDIRVVYPKKELMQARQESPDIFLYRKLDSHWNQAGAYIGARSMAEELGIEMPLFKDISLEPVISSEGDLSDILGIKIKNGDIGYNVSGFSELNAEYETFDDGFIYNTPGADPRTLFVKRDSYSLTLAPNIAPYFEKSVWVHNMYFNQNQIFEYYPEIFIVETVERYETELIDFRISFVSSAIEELEDGTRNILITPAIGGADLQYVSIFKKKKDSDSLEYIQVLESFNEELIINIPENESGEIYMYIFEDAMADEVIEEIIIDY